MAGHLGSRVRGLTVRCGPVASCTAHSLGVPSTLTCFKVLWRAEREGARGGGRSSSRWATPPNSQGRARLKPGAGASSGWVPKNEWGAISLCPPQGISRELDRTGDAGPATGGAGPCWPKATPSGTRHPASSRPQNLPLTQERLPGDVEGRGLARSRPGPPRRDVTSGAARAGPDVGRLPRSVRPARPAATSSRRAAGAGCTVRGPAAPG